MVIRSRPIFAHGQHCEGWVFSEWMQCLKTFSRCTTNSMTWCKRWLPGGEWEKSTPWQMNDARSLWWELRQCDKVTECLPGQKGGLCRCVSVFSRHFYWLVEFLSLGSQAGGYIVGSLWTVPLRQWVGVAGCMPVGPSWRLGELIMSSHASVTWSADPLGVFVVGFWGGGGDGMGDSGRWGWWGWSLGGRGVANN